MKRMKRLFSLLLCAAMIVTSVTLFPDSTIKNVSAEGTTGWAKVVGDEQSLAIPVVVRTIAYGATDSSTDQLGTAQYTPG